MLISGIIELSNCVRKQVGAIRIYCLPFHVSRAPLSCLALHNFYQPACKQKIQLVIIVEVLQYVRSVFVFFLVYNYKHLVSLD